MTRHYQCPGCGSTVEYDPSVKKLVCPYCGEMYTVEEQKRRFAVSDTRSAEPMDESVRDGRRERAVIPMTVLQCCSCGAELMVNRMETSSFCAYCGQATVVTDRLRDYLEPEYIVPFQVTKESAEKTIRRRLSKGFFVPEGIKQFKTERLRGIYIPYWLFDMYHSDEQLWQYFEGKQEFYSYRAADCSFRRLTMEASERFNDEYSMRLEPYDTSKLKKFDAAYLSGFYSDRFDVGLKRAKTMAQARVRNMYNKEIKEKIPGKRKAKINSNPKTDVVGSEYALLPVWFLTFRYEDRPYTILVNGQTGKMVGAVPFVKTKAIALFTVLSAVFCTLLSVLFYYVHYIFAYTLTHSKGSGGNSLGRVVGYYFVGIIALFGWTWVTSIKRYRHMKKSIGLTCANSTNRFVKERQDR